MWDTHLLTVLLASTTFCDDSVCNARIMQKRKKRGNIEIKQTGMQIQRETRKKTAR
jgi:hypothetical protein